MRRLINQILILSICCVGLSACGAEKEFACPPLEEALKMPFDTVTVGQSPVLNKIPKKIPDLKSGEVAIFFLTREGSPEMVFPEDHYTIHMYQPTENSVISKNDVNEQLVTDTSDITIKELSVKHDDGTNLHNTEIQYSISEGTLAMTTNRQKIEERTGSSDSNYSAVSLAQHSFSGQGTSAPVSMGTQIKEDESSTAGISSFISDTAVTLATASSGNTIGITSMDGKLRTGTTTGSSGTESVSRKGALKTNTKKGGSGSQSYSMEDTLMTTTTKGGSGTGSVTMDDSIVTDTSKGGSGTQSISRDDRLKTDTTKGSAGLESIARKEALNAETTALAADIESLSHDQDLKTKIDQKNITTISKNAMAALNSKYADMGGLGSYSDKDGLVPISEEDWIKILNDAGMLSGIYGADLLKQLIDSQYIPTLEEHGLLKLLLEENGELLSILDRDFSREFRKDKSDTGNRYALEVDLNVNPGMVCHGHLFDLGLDIYNTGDATIYDMVVVLSVPENTDFNRFNIDDVSGNGLVHYYLEDRNLLLIKVYRPLNPGETLRDSAKLRMDPWEFPDCLFEEPIE